ncbi:glutamine-hydrolyzing GMP synthase [Methanonatronarchaeum sp. AMET6-2]|uniref:glutamine-hydrolyzing GMP synthase n=1 Tax=Methanonatronarchaeum sp. AMET6-2 TaxID=2933293 RepID=UPI001228CF69|nr:glutamine-hydrolyzing GMP synthase [Methanonatronarchaeum sp. AMET6-2]RZN63003.1 MAG: glutamine-hydrolyzing GMP synthase subunit GuaA [Methanonatronarchaeia archaeon]UOY09987.1 glutamine-hydrolyzing GMP synthase [Methanonatronarchaeum sp. AMET6-2]
MVEAKKFIEEAVEDIDSEIDGDAMIALSGGVDSSVCAELAYRAIGDRLHPVFVDTGLMRKGEVSQIKDIFSHMNLRVVEARDRFIGELEGVVDPEEKRRVVGRMFIRIFEEVARELDIDYLIQGTIYPDKIESEGGIKSHHNVGGLPERVDFESIVEPVEDLYKDEVRVVGRELGLPEVITERMPFPGPGLGVRVLGEVNREKLSVVREANAIVEEEIMDLEPWQAFAALLGRGTGVKGDKRVHGWIIAVRAVESRDGMTARAMDIPMDRLRKIGQRITREIDMASRVVYDVTDKPPATIEYE